VNAVGLAVTPVGVRLRLLVNSPPLEAAASVAIGSPLVSGRCQPGARRLTTPDVGKLKKDQVQQVSERSLNGYRNLAALWHIYNAENGENALSDDLLSEA
jgi:hypothetical protein